jgi:hypothetical protein
MALGARVEIWSQGSYQFTEHFLTRGYASSVDPVIHFGLSGKVTVDSVRVTWPASGNISVVKNIGANRTLDIDEAQSQPSQISDKQPESHDLLFEKSDNIFSYIHEQTDFIDFIGNQNIMPHKFSQIGPCMAKGDMDNDGTDDLITGATNRLPTMVFLRKGDGFSEVKFEGLTTPKPFSESDLAIVDMDGDGDNDVVAVAGGYENSLENEYQHYLYTNNNGRFIRTGLPVPAFPAAVVRPFDFDHDGDTDLFVGSRVKKGMFPYANHSWIILNDKGRLSVNEACRINLGMVTDAVWTDYDKDGWEDLLVAREWNSLVMMKNAGGKQFVPQKVTGQEDHHGIWYSIAAGDFDRDGDDDYIAGNLGDNHRFTADDRFPMHLYAIDLDLDGNIDPLTTAYWKDKSDVMKEYPVNYLDELWAQSTFFQKKYNDYTTFSLANIDDMMDENLLKRLEFKLQVNTTSSYVIWNEKGALRWDKLPRQVQVSPVSRMIVRDFNGDGYPDILLAGNDYTYDVATGYYDAGKGIVLLNRGKNQQSFDILSPSESGILLQGMVGSLLYFEGDTALIVAGINRGKTLVFKQKSK